MRQLDVSIAIIHHAGKILICQRRKSDTFANLWEFPGGKVEAGETPQQGLTREIEEELGIMVHIIAPFTIIEHSYPHCSVRLFPFLCMAVSGEPQPLASQKLRWVAPAELGDYAFPEANAPLLQEIIASFIELAGLAPNPGG